MQKKKIALIIDTENWAFDNIAHQVKKNLNCYDIDIIPGRSYKIKVDTDLSPTQIQERIGVRYVR